MYIAFILERGGEREREREMKGKRRKWFWIWTFPGIFFADVIARDEGPASVLDLGNSLSLSLSPSLPLSLSLFLSPLFLSLSPLLYTLTYFDTHTHTYTLIHTRALTPLICHPPHAHIRSDTHTQNIHSFSPSVPLPLSLSFLSLLLPPFLPLSP